MSRPLILGTRGSLLALVQAHLAQQVLREAGVAQDVTIAVLGSRGDSNRACAIEQIGGRGVFTDELDQAVAEGRVDLAVHSAKDLPVPLGAGLVLAATLARADAREAFISTRHARLADVPGGGVLGSASLRREAMVKSLRPDLSFRLLRGNVDERVAALDRLDLDGTILAVAGLQRLGLERYIREVLPPETLMPDPGQGAIALVCRADDLTVRRIAARVNHVPTLQAVTAERAFLGLAGGRFIVGALASIRHSVITLAASAHLGRGEIWRGSAHGPADAPLAVARKLTAALPTQSVRGAHA
jgi:hydroxymethylbilane synthase